MRSWCWWLAACTASDPAVPPTGDTGDTSMTDPGDAARPHPLAHACLEDGDPGVDWASLSNPILSAPDVALKDLTVRHVDGTWHVFLSHIAEDPFRFTIGHHTSDDLTTWFGPEPRIDLPAAGGLASPDLTRGRDGRYVLTVNSHTFDDDEGRNKPYVVRSDDLRSWGPPEPVARDVRGELLDRVIDLSFAHTDAGLVAAWKWEQTPEVAWSASGTPEGPWTLLGTPATGGVENVQFLPVDGTWHQLATRLSDHAPAWFVLDGDPAVPEDWTSWRFLQTFDVPAEDWNTAERANAAWLCDARSADGHWYLFYAGSTELERFKGRGHAKIGIARSTDLVVWEVP